MNLVVENTLERLEQVIFDQNGTKLVIVNNESDETQAVTSEINRKNIHFYFCLDGSARFEFSPHYTREIQKQRNYFMYNPESDLPFTLRLSPGARMVFLFIPLESLHKLFTHEPLHFLKAENANYKFYDERDIPSTLMITLTQLFNIQLSENARALYIQGKIFELLSLYFSEKKANTESCPFLNNEETVRKIKHAKEHILKHMDNPPGLKELARIAGLNEFQLKVGFKEIYGNTVFGYLLDHKLDYSRLQLDTGKYKVNEVATQIGYTNPSHYIAAFRKKFGITPKKYLMQSGH